MTGGGTAGHYFACLPFLTGSNETIVEDPGLPDVEACCLPRATTTGDFGAGCSSDDDCNPDAFCVARGPGGPLCTKLCVPFSGSAASDCRAGEVCLNGARQETGFCVAPEVAAAEGAPCDASEAGRPCADDDTVCLDLGDGPACARVCKRDLNDSTGANPGCPLLSLAVDPDQLPRTCRTDVTFAAPNPPWLSACGFAP